MLHVHARLATTVQSYNEMAFSRYIHEVMTQKGLGGGGGGAHPLPPTNMIQFHTFHTSLFIITPAGILIRAYASEKTKNTKVTSTSLTWN